jgi:hypothetical protein
VQELNPRESRFIQKWTVQRKHKLKFLLIYGCIYWGLPFGLMTIIGQFGFHFEHFSLPALMVITALFIVAGLFYGNSMYKRHEEIYNVYLVDDEVIRQGVITIGKENQWEYENLTIIREEDDSFLVWNNLFWFGGEHPTTDEINECMRILKGDLNRLKENKAFAAFTENKKIKIQLFDNQDKRHPLAEQIF